MSQTTESVPRDWWAREGAYTALADYFEHHLMHLHVSFRRGGPTQNELFTGFLVEHRGILFWITAGHCLTSLCRMREDQSVQIGGAAFIDDFGGGIETSIHVDLTDSFFMPFILDAQGIDLGIVPLRPFFAEQILANPNTRPLTEEVWHPRKAETPPDGYYVVGTPYECNVFRSVASTPTTERVQVSLPILSLPVEPILDRGKQHPLDDFWGMEGAFYGRLLDGPLKREQRIKSIRGMSGGPVFSIEWTPDGRQRYYLVGVQSCWLESELIVRATNALCIPAVLDMLFQEEQSGVAADGDESEDMQ